MQQSDWDKKQGTEKTEERKSEATSHKTLRDIEESEKVPNPKPTGAAEESSLPSPDGTSDDARKDNDGAGPM
ncbi:MAG TPA: hypothetical protein VGJ55_15960 [Pyrinomonadaceae bacterium]|jgi:hypothetical protein